MNITDGPADDIETPKLDSLMRDNAIAWQRGWTYLADNSIAPLDHRLRDLLKVTTTEEWAAAPPRLRAALTDLWASVMNTLAKLPVEE